MLATVLSQSEDLLVVREHEAKLPELVKQGRFAPSNVRLVSQLDGEAHRDFVVRVLTRAIGKSGITRPFRGAVVSLQADPGPDMVESRVRLLSGIAAALAPQSDAELVILAPANVGALERIRLFELVEATLQAVPHQNVRLAFAAPESKSHRANGAVRRAAQVFEA